MAEVHRRIAIQRKCIKKYRTTAPSSRKINLWYQGYNDCESHSHRGGSGRPRPAVQKQNQIEEMFRTDPNVRFKRLV